MGWGTNHQLDIHVFLRGGGWCHKAGDLLLVDNLAVAHRADILAHEVSIPGIAAPRVLHRSTVRGVVGVGKGELRSVVKFHMVHLKFTNHGNVPSGNLT